MMPPLLIIILALVMLLVCLLIVAGQQRRHEKLNELLAAYEDSLKRYAAQPQNHKLATASRLAGEEFYNALLPGAYSLRFQEAHYPIDDFYSDYRSLTQGLMAADFSLLSNSRTEAHPPAPARAM